MADNVTDQVSLKDLTSDVGDTRGHIKQLEDTIAQLNAVLQSIMQSGGLAALNDALASQADNAADAAPGIQPPPPAEDGLQAPQDVAAAGSAAPTAAIKDMLSTLTDSLPKPGAAGAPGATAESPATSQGGAPGDAGNVAKAITNIDNNISTITKNTESSTGAGERAGSPASGGAGNMPQVPQAAASAPQSIKAMLQDNATEPGKPLADAAPSPTSPALPQALHEALAADSPGKAAAQGSAAPSIMNLLHQNDASTQKLNNSVAGEKGADIRNHFMPQVNAPAALTPADDPQLALPGYSQHSHQETENALHHNQANISGGKHQSMQLSIGSLLQQLNIKTSSGTGTGSKDIKKIIISTLQEAVNQTDQR